ncbi:TetR/AcrR family transcriptional regulator [Bradyrhizobium liaoningense]|uniref:TetR/AcrR family transcriptional regulator n=1 Tax=Bradyrhizobium liaoningense TaxID=43992 RepID=UPI001BADA50E|nr:TetR/AcrR family transcriptional regulator [Bradyrhizobium liaoningense]MBR0717083.1 TetR/AcrR family transcriptional regulator [Bradyrhizobium liaoningense]
MPAVPRHRQPIINAAVTLFRRQGYARTGLNDIVDASGAPKGSLYHYFPGGKSSIAAAAVEEAGRRVAATVKNLAAECRSTGELLRAHARLLAGWMRSSGFRNGCPITTVLLELAPRERAISEAGRKAYAARVAIIRDKLVEDGFARPRAEALAVLCTSALQGALIQARVERSGRAIEVTAAELARLLEDAAKA